MARNSSRLESVEEAIKQAEIGVEMLLDQWENICILNEYLDSGEWQSDFEADERGEISKDIPRGVLSEDGLYNALDRLHDVLDQMTAIVDHILIPDEEAAIIKSWDNIFNLGKRGHGIKHRRN